ncbi:MAG TPA: DUF4132 domain-containing protein, partial [Labilithrix sp.]|nr:DUF4132 domain-containing protein [Labilithrix sp.]
KPASAPRVALPPTPAAVVSAPASAPSAASDTSAPQDEASLDELPRVLARPPWLEPVAKKAPPVVEGLSLLDSPERAVFTDAQRASWGEPSMSRRDVRQYLMRDPPPESDQAAMDAFIVGKLPRGMRYLSGWLESMSPAAALKWVLENDIGIAYPDFYELRWLLVRFGVEALPAVLRYSEKEPSVGVHALAHVDSPRVARFMALHLGKSRSYLGVASEYFARFPETSAIAVLPLALAKATQRSALRALQVLAQGEREATVRAVAARYGEAASQALDPLLSLDLDPKKIPVLPAWLAADKLPPVLLRGSEHRLPGAAVGHLATLLALCDPRQAHDRLDEVKSACTPDSLARFAWGLFQTWLSEGAEAKQAWAFTAVGHLGGDDAARRLAPLVRAWPGESAHARAVKGLDVLAQIGSDVALMHLDGIAEKVKFKGLQENAREKIEEVAKERALTRDELADRIAPTLDLDETGSRVLSFGTRSFRVGFDEHLAPFVTDEAGKRSDLPKPRASDDAEVAAASVQAWKTLKKDAKAVASSQIRRLERAMCSQRRWKATDFQTLLVAHPLVVHLARRLLWAVYEGPRIARLFRVAEDRSFGDADDGLLTLADDATVGLPHRLELADDDLRRWGQVFGDYEILQPFPQLDRDVYAVTDAERAAEALERTKDVEVPTGRVLGLLERGWQKGAPQDAGWIWDMQKALPGDLFAELSLGGGLLAGAMAESPPTQKLGALSVRRGAGSIPLGEMPALVFSELVRDLEGLRA